MQAFNSDKVRGILQSTVAGYSPQCEVVDPVWKLLAKHRDLEKITALPANVEELNPGNIVN